MHHIMCELPVSIITLLANVGQFPYAPEMLYVQYLPELMGASWELPMSAGSLMVHGGEILITGAHISPLRSRA